MARAYYIYGDDRRSNSIFRKLLEAADAGKTVFPLHIRQEPLRLHPRRGVGASDRALADATDVVGTLNCCTGAPVSLSEKVEEFIAENDLRLSLEYGVFPDRPYDSPGCGATRLSSMP